MAYGRGQKRQNSSAGSGSSNADSTAVADGISLTEDQWNLLVGNFDAIGDALTALDGGKKPKLSDPIVPEEERKQDADEENVKNEVKDELPASEEE
ncbi:hypothetical protein BN7_5777 [Wickerhamomyces ciferrii]|uniref:Uncharacterized protein n=1 Tax=Wickerhamomyces ciferrii (strain ATCC 14091 / BCRC 22168 / CBS 111 / JCM 3599 / NBRC 0793 / NRRL Y-1031 F-60-10) TaxID=1206466 RepID=K0KYN4_WICCF|nr:uncharacterized protein BN7_5777 [Wickerhamomyces ciferrii]CCH46188.1 hypothetical protein BN7_5777 [Wickerhamomyces ciferrii]